MRVREVLEQGIDDGTHIGAQIYVSHQGEVAADFAVGNARADVAMTTDSMMTWFSMTKAVTSVAVAQQWERRALEIDERVVTYIPEFGAHGKDVITLRHLLTHTAGIPLADGILEMQPWLESNEESLARICDAPLDYEPGTRAGYHPTAGMTVLGEIVARVSGQPYREYVRNKIFLPLGMDDCWVGMPEETWRAYGDRIGHMHNTQGDEPVRVAGVDSARRAANPMPGANGRGPMNQLGKFYEGLPQLIGPATLAAVASRHRTEMVDEMFGVVIDWGLGFTIDAYAMGRYCSRRTFGHGGSQSSIAFLDPSHRVVVAVVCNGMCGVARHYPRLDAICSAVYLDLGLAQPDDPGRAKPIPTSAL
jgi:CubicO group peptidase (beta-lactamase class C family)